MSDLIVFEKESAAELFRKEEGIQPLLDSIADEVGKFEPDMTTEKGRKEIKSMAYKVSQTKTAIDKYGSDLVADQKKAIKIVDTERKRSKDFLDKLKHKVRAPLTEWEDAQKARLEKYKGLIEQMEDLSKVASTDWLMTEFDDAFLFLNDNKPDDSWAEFRLAAEKAHDFATTRLSELVIKKGKLEKEKEELEKLRKETAEREQKERDERIAKEAAEKAKAEAEKKAEFDAALKKQEADAAIAKAKREADQKIAYEKKKQELKEQQEADAKALEEKRAADLNHRKEINNGILTSLMKIGVDEFLAKEIIAGVVKGAVPNMKVIY